ncbi:trk system potassium uptake protein TrkH [Methanohalophilus levihalophilus]|uniref:TrkH family potassium uptake protein n=1 Tax=Methanohalophilus levihalophilus TaxID=1431282 RepID=UPI001AE56C37|nr:TrkH family potassium uptake protein [Methanohalophilus levihalophilus]MBP2029647.1 trk system potassium uptake protein TrkH [Methanohalophilus levihalophilus]
MRFGVVVGVVGSILWLISGFMFIPLLVSVYYGESLFTFGIPLTVTVFVAAIFTLFLTREDEEWNMREGFFIVASGWLVAAIFCSLPYIIEGVPPINALFEAMSGVTATGATALADIESHSRSLLFWRAMTQWLGGMGIIMLFIAILPKLGIAGRQMFRAEVPGLQEEQLRPRIRETAKILWLVYIVLSLIEIAALSIAGLTFYDAVTHTFTSISCSGFSTYSDSIAAFGNPTVEAIFLVFMFLGGANFALHYKTIFADKTSLVKDQEFQFYFLIIAVATLVLAFMLFRTEVYSITDAFRYSSFQVISILTTTGYATADFNLWPDSSRFILFLLMFIGGCAGSTSGGIKVVRFLLLVKYAGNVLFKVIHPKAIKPIRFNEKVVPDEVIQSIVSFMVIYFMIFVVSSSLLSLMGMDFVTTLSASIATLGNVGPGLGLVGPMANFDAIPDLGKLILIANMWIGRLEVFTVIVLLTPAFWRH